MFIIKFIIKHKIKRKIKKNIELTNIEVLIYYFLSKKYKDIFKSLRFKDIKFNKLTLKEFNILFPYELEKNLIYYLNIAANKDYIKLGVSRDNTSFLYKELDLSKSKDVIILINNEIKTIKKFIKEK